MRKLRITGLLAGLAVFAALLVVGAGPAAAASQSEGNCLGTQYSSAQSNGNGERTSNDATAAPGLGPVVSSYVYQAGTFIGPSASSPVCRSQ
jgi:hypothetical protein